MLGLEINLPGLGEAIIGTGAMLFNPEGMFKTDKDGCLYSGKKNINRRKRIGLIRPMKECKEGIYVIENT